MCGEKDIAFAYLARVVAEFKGRVSIADRSELDAWAYDFREESLGPSVDYLVGPKTIGDLDEGQLSLLRLIAQTRFEYAGYLAGLLSGADAVTFAEWSARDQP